MSDPTNERIPVRPLPTVGLGLNELDGAFRETYLVEVSDPESHAALRGFSKFLNEVTLASHQHSPFERDIDFTAYSLQAGLIDLRHLQHCFILFGSHGPDTGTDDDERKRHRELLRLSMRIAKGIEKLANELEKEVGDWKLEA